MIKYRFKCILDGLSWIIYLHIHLYMRKLFYFVRREEIGIFDVLDQSKLWSQSRKRKLKKII